MKKIAGKIAYKIAPKKLVRKAMEALTHPGSSKMRDFEKTAIDGARRSNRTFKSFKIAEYTWGFGPKKALLIHGWEGRASNFAALIPILVDAGYTVTAFDAPSHGESSQASTTLFDFGELVCEYLNETRFELFITHSFGSVPLSFALNRADGYPVAQLMLITSPDRFSDRVAQIVEQLGFPEQMADDVMDAFDAAYKVDTRSLSVSNYLSHIRPVRALIVHGKNDRVLPLAWSKSVAASVANTTLIELEDTGHYRILWDQRTQRALQHLLTNQPFSENIKGL